MNETIIESVNPQAVLGMVMSYQIIQDLGQILSWKKIDPVETHYIFEILIKYIVCSLLHLCFFFLSLDTFV